MTDITGRLREACPSARDYAEDTHNRLLLHEAADEIERLRAALGRLVNDSMYKDHPEASQMAIDALEGKR